jgi:hypothetical protein
MENAVIKDVISSTDSVIIVLIIVLISGIVALRPIIKMWITSREKQQDKLLAVIQANTDVNASLKTVLEEDRKRCAECRSMQLSMFKQIQETQDVTNMKLVEIHTVLSTKEAAKNGEN